MVRSDSAPRSDPAVAASLMRQLAEAPDTPSFLAIMRERLPPLLPATRIDILVEGQSGLRSLLSCGPEAEPPPVHAARTSASLVEWLGRQGYGMISTLPLAAAGQRQGWLILARRSRPLDPSALTLAGQLATLIGLRRLYDQGREELAERDERIHLLNQRLRELEEVRLRATLAAGAAHDISNLFASVLGYAQLLQQEAASNLQGDLRMIVRAAKDGQFLLRRLLSIKPGLKRPSVAPIAPLPATIRDAIRLTQPFWESRPEITIKTALAPVPAVHGYAAEIREVLINLIMNAVAAMPQGGMLTLRTYSMGDRVAVEVTDTGVGIAQEYQSSIFQPFVTTHDAGSGLGLSVSRAIIEGYGGTLTVSSAPGEGATFTLILPVAQPARNAR